MRSPILIGLSCAALLISGCSDSSSDDDNAAANQSLSGKVADGYLAGARVCLDLNTNKVCDANEPSTRSTDGGGYSFEGLTAEQVSSAPILVEIIVGETVDEDNPGVAITKKYSLTAPPGYTFVSPLTTMVQNEAEEKGVSADEAKGAIQARLGTTADLEADYVAGSNDETQGTEFARLHKVAQVTTVILQKNIEVVEQVLAGSDVNFDDLVAIIVNQVIDALDTISTQVNAADDETFDPEQLADSDGLQDANVDAAKVEEEIEERETQRALEVASVAQILADGGQIHFFESDVDYQGETPTPQYSYGTVAKNPSDNSVVITKTGYSSQGGWQNLIEEQTDNDSVHVLTTNGWTQLNEDNETITIDGDKVIVVIDGEASTAQEITGVSAPLEGRRIANFLDDKYLFAIDPLAEFDSTATGYKLSFVRNNPMYALFLDNEETAATCWDGNVQVGENWNPTDGYCNNVFLRDGDPLTEDGAAATSLAQLITTSAASNPGAPSDIKGTPIYGRDFEVILELVEGGIANYYRVEYTQQAPEEPPLEQPSEGVEVLEVASGVKLEKFSASWTQQTINGQTLLRFKLPPLLAELGDFDDDEREQFFAVFSGYVRRGGIAPAGSQGDDEWVFNDAGKNQVLAAFDYSLVAGLTACDNGNTEMTESPEGVVSGGASLAQFSTLVTNCGGAQVVTAQTLAGLTLITDFGFLEFDADGQGTFLGEVGDNDKAVLNFSWSITEGNLVVINTSSSEGGETRLLRLTFAILDSNARDVSVKALFQEGSSSAELDSGNGDVESPIWGKN